MFVLASLLIAGPAGAQAPHRYVLEATLDPTEHSVAGEATIRFTNTSRVPLENLLFHLYLNAFADDASVFMQESGGSLRGDRFHGHGSIEVHSLLLGETDLLPNANDELIEGDHTQLEVPLPTPLAPGASIELEVRFTSQLPPVFARSGYDGDFHMVAQWFPKLAKLDEQGWVTFPYHGNGEFYADFADYELRVHVPAGWSVGATGTSDDGEYFVAERVHDCAFAAAPWFERQTRQVERSEGAPLELIALYPPGYDAAARAMIDTTIGALGHFGENYGVYPYDTLTTIMPPSSASGAAGMEYPMLFMSAGPFFDHTSLPFGSTAPLVLQEHVTAHELGHQWFQGMVASNEVAFPMLDEGLTEWSTTDYLKARYGQRSAAHLPFVDLPVHSFHRLMALAGAPTPPPGRPAYAFDHSQYGRSVYMRSTTIFETVARTWGRQRFLRALGRYARAQRYQHPTPREFFAAMDAEYGSWMSRRVLRPALMDGVQDARRLEIDPRDEGGVVLRAHRFGLPLPSKVLVEDAQGNVTMHPWPSTRWTFELELDESPRRVVIDPHRQNLMDSSRRDDAIDERDHGYFPRIQWVLETLLSWVGA